MSHFTVLLKRSSESGYSLMTTELFNLKMQTQTQTLPWIWLVTYFLLSQANSWTCWHYCCRKTTGTLYYLATPIKLHSHSQLLLQQPILLRIHKIRMVSGPQTMWQAAGNSSGIRVCITHYLNFIN